MRKAGLLTLLEQLKTNDEEKTEELKYLTALEIVDLLLDYINDPQIRESVEDIPL